VLKLSVTSGQLEYEVKHLKRKLKVRDRKKLVEILKEKKFISHPLFRVKKGSREEWEIIKEK
jgi:hypothetical protein